MNGLALCAGIGGMELGLKFAISGYRCVGYCEWDAYAAAVLVARMEDSALDRAPIWDDLTTFPGSLYRSKVDLISAGFPCQPFSVAGQRKGTDDVRWIWGDIARIVGDIQPRYVFLENVSGLLAHSGGFGTVLGDLAALGFDAEWGVFSAAEVGAPHLRRRVFVLAYSDGTRRNERARYLWRKRRDISECTKSAWLSKTLGNASSIRRARSHATESLRPSRSAGALTASTTFPPSPSGDWSAVHPSLEPAVCGVADGPTYRVDRLRCLGNGVVPLVAAVAWRELIGRARVRAVDSRNHLA